MANAAEILKLCRLCLVKDQVTIPIFDGQGDVKQIFLKITACLPIKVSRKDCLPKSICNACLLKLEVLYEFWNTTANSEKTLITWLNEAGVDTTNCNAIENNQIIPEEIILKEEAIDVADRDHAVDDISSDAKNYASDQQAPVTYNTPSFEFQNDILNAQGKKESPSKKSNNESSAKRKRAPSTRRRTPTAKAIKYEEETEEESAGEDFAAKVEDDSDYVADNDTSIMGFDQDESIDEPPPTSSASDQPGPSGVQKATGEPPSTPDGTMKSKKKVVKVRPKPNAKGGQRRAQKSKKPLNAKPDATTPTATKTDISDAIHCDMCDKLFDDHTSYGVHLMTHSKSKKYTCHICDHKSKSKKVFERHVKTHEGKTRFKCEICQKAFTIGTHALEHKYFHTGETPFQCDICGKSFMYSRFLSSHRRSYHLEIISGEPAPNYTCLICNVVYTKYSSYKKHNMRKHLDQEPHLCDVCGKVLSSAEMLKFHQRTHTGYKPFGCATCGKNFTKKQRLVEHERVHTGERPFICKYCGKGFTQRPPLKIHERTHTGERPYSCKICQRGYISKGAMDSHMKNCGQNFL